jgi:hypothetical protein
MIAAVGTLSSLSSPRRSSIARRGFMDRFGPAIGIAIGFLCFMPYPAMAVGNSSSLQMGNILCILLLIPAFALRWRHRPIFFFPLLMAPLVISAVKAGVTQTGDLAVCFNTLSMWAIALVSLFIAQLFVPKYGLQILTGIAAAAILHTAVGLCQLYSFSNGEFPFLGLYVNQAFANIQENADTIAKYIQRPFGIFPEPSAMASSLAPWLVFWVAELCGVVRLRQTLARWQRILFAVAAAGSLLLIILSSSGHTMITLAALLFIGMLWFRKLRATPRTFAVVLPVMAACAPLVIWMAATVMANRIEGEWQVNNSSWEDRSSSLVVGFDIYAHGDVPTILFGLGVGLSPAALLDAAHLDAVWSVLLTYLYETGMVGAVVICFLGAYLLRVWRASDLNPAFAGILIVWLVGITVTTSYSQLLPIWIALGWLTVWPAVCTSVEPEPIRKRTLEVARPDLTSQPRRNTWTSTADVPSGAAEQ